MVNYFYLHLTFFSRVPTNNLYDAEHIRSLMLPVVAKAPTIPAVTEKPKGRGRPRKIRPEGSEGEAVKKQRGRPPGSGEAKKPGKRGRPPKVRPSSPLSSSDDEMFEKPAAPARKRPLPKKESSSSDSSPSPIRRRPSYSERDASLKKKSSKSPRLSEEARNAAKHRDSDEEWGEKNRPSVKSLFQDKNSDR